MNALPRFARAARDRLRDAGERRLRTTPERQTNSRRAIGALSPGASELQDARCNAVAGRRSAARSRRTTGARHPLSWMRETTMRCLCTPAVLGLGDQLLDVRSQRLRLRSVVVIAPASDDDQVRSEVREHQLLVRGASTEALALLRSRHDVRYSLTRSDKPRSSSFWMTSSEATSHPKLVIASRSSSDFCTS